MFNIKALTWSPEHHCKMKYCRNSSILKIKTSFCNGPNLQNNVFWRIIGPSTFKTILPRSWDYSQTFKTIIFDVLTMVAKMVKTMYRTGQLPPHSNWGSWANLATQYTIQYVEKYKNKLLMSVWLFKNHPKKGQFTNSACLSCLCSVLCKLT